MEILWMLVIGAAAVAAAVLIGNRLETRLTLRVRVKDRGRLHRSLEQLGQEGVDFAEQSYLKGLIPLERVKPLAAEYVRHTLAKLYQAKVVTDEGCIEELIEEITDPEERME